VLAAVAVILVGCIALLRSRGQIALPRNRPHGTTVQVAAFAVTVVEPALPVIVSPAIVSHEFLRVSSAARKRRVLPRATHP
jgi:hypothetical protein